VTVGITSKPSGKYPVITLPGIYHICLQIWEAKLVNTLVNIQVISGTGRY